MKSSAGDGVARTLLFLIVIGTLFVVAAKGGLGGGSTPGTSAESTESEGHRALALLLEANGYRTRVWNEQPGLLSGEGVLVLRSQPHDLFSSASPEGLREPVRRNSDTGHYLRFVEEGGTLLVVGPNGIVEWLGSDLGLAAADELRWDERKRRTRREAVFDVPSDNGSEDPDDEFQLRLTRQAVDALEPLGEASAWEVLATDMRRDRGPRLVRLPVGRGVVAVLAGAELFRNDRLGERDNGLYFLRALEALGIGPGGPPIQFDDYAEGGWSPASPLALALGPSTRLVTLHLLLLAIVFLWAVGWVGPFPRDTEGALRKAVAPAARARGVANLYVKAGRWDLLGRLLQRGTLRELVPTARTDRFRRPPVLSTGKETAESAAENAVDPGPEAGDGEARDRSLLDLYLKPVFVARRGEAEWPSVREDLSRRVRTEDELARLDRDLRRLRTELSAPLRHDGSQDAVQDSPAPSPARASLP